MTLILYLDHPSNPNVSINSLTYRWKTWGLERLHPHQYHISILNGRQIIQTQVRSLWLEISFPICSAVYTPTRTHSSMNMRYIFHLYSYFISQFAISTGHFEFLAKTNVSLLFYLWLQFFVFGRKYHRKLSLLCGCRACSCTKLIL